MDIKRDVTIKSWDGTWTYHPKVIVTPESAEDLVEILTDEVRFPAPVRPAGSMHSTARMNGDDGGTMVDMTKMNRILHFTEDTVTVEAGATYIVVSDALKNRGLQFHVTTEIGNVTLGAIATAATKDSSFPGGFGQVSSYVTAVRLVTPQGTLREINERDNPEEMQIIRSSYGLMGVVYEVTIRVRPTTALSVRHYSLSLDNFRRYYPIYKARGFAVMYYIFPYVKRVLVELRKDNPETKPTSRYRWVYRNRFWRKYGPAVTLWIERMTSNRKLRAYAETRYRCNLPSVGYAIARDVEALLSYSWEGATLSIDPASTGGAEWEEFLHHYNEFCSEWRGVPLFNQTPFLTREQARRAFGVRLQQFAARRKAADPKNRMLDSYFRELLS